MTYKDDLLKQALHLATWDRRRPKQANLRRAISTAYYALFHFLISEAVNSWRIEYQRPVLARAFEHGKMKAACLRSKLSSADLRNIANAFVDLQQARHLADYDTAFVWTRVETITLIQLAEQSCQSWERIRNERPAVTSSYRFSSAASNPSYLPRALASNPIASRLFSAIGKFACSFAHLSI